MALTELARYLPKVNHHNRYLRGGMRPHLGDGRRHDDEPEIAFEPVAAPVPSESTG